MTRQLKLGVLLLVGVVASAAVAQANAKTIDEAKAPADKVQSEPTSVAGPDYKIGPDDMLHVSVWKEPDLTETTTVARAMELIQGGFVPIVFGFRRARYNRSHVASWREIELGQTEDGKYGRRLKALARALAKGRRFLSASERRCASATFAYSARTVSIMPARDDPDKSVCTTPTARLASAT